MTNSAELVAYLPASLRARGRGASRARPAVVRRGRRHDGHGRPLGLHGALGAARQLGRRGRRAAHRRSSTRSSRRMLETAFGYGGDTLTFGGDAILLLFDGAGACQPGRRRVAGDAQAGRARGGRRFGRRQGQDRHVGRRPQRHASCWRPPDSTEERAHLFVLGRGAELTALAEAAGRTRRARRLVRDEGPAAGRLETDADRRLLAGRRALGRVLPRRRRASARGLSQRQLRRLAPFLPPYARTGAGNGGGRARRRRPSTAAR